MATCKKFFPRRTFGSALAGLLCAFLLCGPARFATAQTPTWLNSAVIYCINPEIFSASGFSGVTAQIPRLKNLGVNVLWLMPLYPRGQACTVAGVAHPAYDSPYCIHDYKAVNPSFGTSADLTKLIGAAHGSGMKVILDAVCNHTSWDNPLVTQHPEYYLHSDGDPTNVASIEQAGNYADVAQLNYATTQYGLQDYMTSMLEWWLTTYNVDGFRFDYADNPVGSGASIPKSFWTALRPALESVKPDILMLGEEEDVNLATAPFEVDYGWNMYHYGTLAALKHTLDATTLQYQWQWPYTINVAPPAGMKHLNIQDDWDQDRDIVTYGGAAQAMAAAAFDFTTDGIPLVYNGMEVGNSTGGVNPHTPIDWTNPNASAFTAFYTQLLSLRSNSHTILQQGPTTWVKTSSPSQVSSYYRGGNGNGYLIEINTAASAVTGTLSPPFGGGWVDVTPAGSPGGTAHTAPPNFSLRPYDFAVFHRGGSLSGTVTLVTSVQPFNLTTQGTTDWGAWGYDKFDHSASGGSKISDAVAVGGGTLTAFTSGFWGFTWTNGAPDAKATNETKGYSNSGGTGFTFTVPASATSQKVTVYVGGKSGGGTLTATLSDSSAPVYTNSSLSNASGSYYGSYTLTFKAASSSQKLTVVWKRASGTGSMALYAAALH